MKGKTPSCCWGLGLGGMRCCGGRETSGGRSRPRHTDTSTLSDLDCCTAAVTPPMKKSIVLYVAPSSTFQQMVDHKKSGPTSSCCSFERGCHCHCEQRTSLLPLDCGAAAAEPGQQKNSSKKGRTPATQHHLQGRRHKASSALCTPSSEGCHTRMRILGLQGARSWDEWRVYEPAPQRTPT